MKLLSLLAATAVISTPALSADAILYTEPAPQVLTDISTYSWSGGYIGAQAGYAWGDSTYTEPEYPGYEAHFDPDGFLGGIYAGYNYQLGNNVVLGGELDFALSGVDGESLYYSDYTEDPWDDTLGTAEMKWSGALRARAGYAFDRFMPYLAGGVAFARYEYGIWDSSDDTGFNASETMTGWTIGGGAEYAATDNLILRAEYRYSDFGDNRVDEAATTGWYTNDVDLKTHDIRLGIAYKF